MKIIKEHYSKPVSEEVGVDPDWEEFVTGVNNDNCEAEFHVYIPLESMILDAEQKKASAEKTMVEMDYKEMCDLFRAVEKTGAGHVTGHVVFTESSFTALNGVESRTFVVSSNNKAFQPNMAGYSIYGSSLDGSEPIARLDSYMAAEQYGPGGWQIEKCYMRCDEIHKAHGIINHSRDEHGEERE